MQGKVEQIAHMLPKGTKDEAGLLEHLEAAILDKQMKAS
jgi:hypothetical protein